MKLFSGVLILALVSSLLLIGCSNAEPEIEPNMPMGKPTDKFQPTSVTGAAGPPPEKGAPGDDKAKTPDEK